MLAIGALLGGLATSLLGVQAAFVLDALTFLLSAWFVTRIAVAADGRPEPAQRTTVGSGLIDFVEGMRYLLGRRTLLVIALVKAGGALIWGGINVLEIPLAEQLFPLGGNGSLTLGLIYAAVGLGTGFGPLVLRARLGDSLASMAKAITISFACMTVGVFGLALSPTLPWLLVSTLVRGVGSGGLWVFATVLLQILVPDRLRGRVFAFEFAALTLTQSLSTWWAGEVYDAGMALSQILLASGVASAVVSLAWWLFQRRRGPSLVVRIPEGP